MQVLLAITFIVVIALVDLIVRFFLKSSERNKLEKERKQALDIGLKLDVSKDTPTLKRVSLDNPVARILAVDDETIILDSFRKILVMAGYAMDTVETGQEVLKLV